MALERGLSHTTLDLTVIFGVSVISMPCLIGYWSALYLFQAFAMEAEGALAPTKQLQLRIWA